VGSFISTPTYNPSSSSQDPISPRRLSHIGDCNEFPTYQSSLWLSCQDMYRRSLLPLRCYVELFHFSFTSSITARTMLVQPGIPIALDPRSVTTFTVRFLWHKWIVNHFKSLNTIVGARMGNVGFLSWFQ
jgi:hypothetical protein